MKRAFTLVELLTVIAIITILAGMTMPAMSYARALGYRTDCMNNKRNILSMMHVYANFSDGVIPFMANGDTWGYILRGDEDRYDKDFVPERALKCTAATADINSGATNTIGMLFATDAWAAASKRYIDGQPAVSNQQHFGKFFFDGDDQDLVYMLTQMRHTSSLILFADSFNQYGNSVWFFDPQTSGDDNTAHITTIHGKDAVVAFADGRAAAGSAKALYDETNSKYFRDSDFALQTLP